MKKYTRIIIFLYVGTFNWALNFCVKITENFEFKYQSLKFRKNCKSKSIDENEKEMCLSAFRPNTRAWPILHYKPIFIPLLLTAHTVPALVRVTDARDPRTNPYPFTRVASGVPLPSGTRTIGRSTLTHLMASQRHRKSALAGAFFYPHT
jgi:hypothetical protein